MVQLNVGILITSDNRCTFLQCDLSVFLCWCEERCDQNHGRPPTGAGKNLPPVCCRLLGPDKISDLFKHIASDTQNIGQFVYRSEGTML